MKLFLIVFLGVCAFTAPILSQEIEPTEVKPLDPSLLGPNIPFEVKNVEIELVEPEEEAEEVYDIIENIKALNEIVQEIFGNAETLHERAEKIATELTEKIPQLYKDIEFHSDEISEEINRFNNNFENQENNWKECIKKYLPNLKEVKRNAKEDLKKCADRASEKAKGVKKNLRNELKGARKILVNVKNEVLECIALKDPKKIVQCVRDKAEELKKQIKEAVQGVVEASRKAVRDLKDIGQGYRECRKNVKLNAIEELRKIGKEIKQCATKGEEKKYQEY